ncbi:MAG: hypothetical protein LBC87_05950 [Fibromonadaceae bacterium]|nr:hypothetical protein [Fibromonadaceae bacterium]
MGEEFAVDKLSDDYLYTRDLGIIRDNGDQTEPANPIYAELIVRTLNWNVQDALKTKWWENKHKRIYTNMTKLCPRSMFFINLL